MAPTEAQQQQDQQQRDERRALAQAIAQAVAEAIVVASAQRPPPSTSEQLQRYVAIGASGLAMVAVLVSGIGWAYQLQASLVQVAQSVQRVQLATDELDDKLEAVLVERWTRSDQARFVTEQVRPLEDRVRALESGGSR